MISQRSAVLFSSLLNDSGFRHAFTTREEGDVDRLAEALRVPRARFYQAKQVHGRNVVTAEGDYEALSRVEADGLVAEPGSGAAVAVRVADCVPVLLADRSTGRVAAVHAGWRGVEARIVDAALDRIDARAVVAAIGPCINPCCFEVDADIAERLSHVVHREDDKAFVDLRAAVRAQLVARNVHNTSIDDVPGCTKHEPERFHSFRRDGANSGRLFGAIVAR